MLDSWSCLLENQYLKVENTTMSAAILSLAVCVCDVTNTASKFGQSIIHIMNQTEPAWQHGCTLWNSDLEEK